MKLSIDELRALVKGIKDKYSNDLVRFKTELQIKGKSLGEANRDQPSLLAYYEEKRIEIDSIRRKVKLLLDEKRGKKWEYYTESFDRDINARDKDNYIKADEEMVKITQIYDDIDILHNKFYMIVEAFKQRGFSLKNITEIYINGIENMVI